MLNLIRKKQKTTLVQVVFWVIIATFIGTIFLVWGRGNEQTREFSVAAEVNGVDISYDQYKSTYSNMYNFYRNIYGQNFTPEMERKLSLSRQAITMLIDQALLLQEADRLNLTIPRDELVEAIAVVPAFQVDGQFSKEKYLSVLTYQRMKPELFEQMQRQQMLVEMTRRVLQSEVVVADEDVADEYRRINEKINLEYLVFAASQFRAQVKLSEEQLLNYYTENQEDFRVPEQLSLDFVQLSPNAYRDEVVLDAAEVERYYNRHISMFTIPEQVSVAHILIKVAAGADEATIASKKQLAQQVLAQAQDGDFAKLVQQYSDDEATVKSGGDLGFFTRGVMDPAFETAAFDLTSGELSGLVKSRFGYHIIKGQGRIAAGVKPLVEVEAEVKSGLTGELAERFAYEKAMDAYNINRKNGSIVAAAQSLNLTTVETGLFGRNMAIPAIGVNADISQRAFALESGQLVSPVKTDAGVFLCEVAEKKGSYVPELEQVRSAVEAELLTLEAVKLAQSTAQQALEKFIAGSALHSLAPTGVSVEETGLFSRTLGDFVPKLGNISGLADVAFGLSVKDSTAKQLFASGEKFYLVRLKQLQPADPTDLTAEVSEQLRTSVLTAKRDALINTKLATLKDSAEVIIAPAILRSIEGSKKK